MSKPMRMEQIRTTKTAVIHCLGCKVNQAEAAAMTQILEDTGFHVDPNADDPAVVIVHTCCVTSRAESKSIRAVGRVADRFPAARLIVTGCLAEVAPASLRRCACDAVILGAREKAGLAAHLGKKCTSGNIANTDGESTFVDLGAAGIPGRARAFLKVQDGCSQRCSYCIVPIARGPSRSLPPQRAIAQAVKLFNQGYAEIVLTGVHLGAYGRDLQPVCTLETLIEDILEQCPEVRVRLSSMEPQEITPQLIDLARRHHRFCRHFHIPLQSGDNRTLGRMGRPYDSALIDRLSHEILSEVPEACIGLDVMVGFPGEDEASFHKTLDLVLRCGAAYLHVFPFSPRPGTPAAHFNPRVPDQAIRDRVQELRQLSSELRLQFYSRFLGSTLDAVVESNPATPGGPMLVRTDNYILVRLVAGDHMPGEKVFPVILDEVLGNDVVGSYA